MEKLMHDSRYSHLPPFSRRFAEGKAEGEAEGEARGKVMGRAMGETEGLARSVLRVLETRIIDVPEDIREKILSCTDQQTLDTWLRRAITAKDAKELFD